MFKLNPAWRRQLSPSDRRLWLLWSVGLRIHVRANPLWEFVIYWKRLLAICVVGAGVFYFGAVTALYARWKRVPENRVTWTAIASAPWRWEELRVLRGETAVAAGLKSLRDRRFSEALFSLRAGVARSPRNVDGRLALAELLGAAGETTEAIRLLEDGVRLIPGSDPLLRALTGVYANGGAWRRLGTLLDEQLAEQNAANLTPAVRQRLLLQRAAVWLETGRADEALKVVRANKAGATGSDARQWLLHELVALRRLDRAGEADALYNAPETRAMPRGGPRVELSIARERSDIPAVETALRQLKAIDPDGFESLLIAYRTWHELGRTTLRLAVAQEIMDFKGRDESALQRLAKLLVELGDKDDLEQVRLVAIGQRFNAFAFDVGLTEIALAESRWDDALRSLAAWESGIDRLPGNQRAYPDLVRRLTRAAFSANTGDIAALMSHAESMRGILPPAVYLQSVRLLERAQRPAVALDLVRVALRRYSFNDELVDQEARLARVVAAQVSVAEQKPALRAEVGAPALEVALKEIDSSITRGELDAAMSQIRAWKAASPTPERAQERAIGLREVRVGLLRDDPAAARFVIRRFLERNPGTEDALTLLALAQELLAAGKAAAGQLLQTEVATARLSAPEVASALEAQGFAGAGLVSAEETRRSLAAAFAAQEYDRAAQLVRLVRRASPEWLGAIEPELALAELRARALAGQVPSAVLALRDILRRTDGSRTAAFEFVRQLARDGQAEAARALADEALRLRPGDENAKALGPEVEKLLAEKR